MIKFLHESNDGMWDIKKYIKQRIVGVFSSFL